jgi:hypothetical protein
MAKEIKFGIREGKGHGKEYPVAASQYFQRRGGHFVFLKDGNINLCSSMTGCDRANGVLGWAEVPKDAAGHDYWVSSSTAAADKVFVITDVDAVYEIPYDGHTASLTATLIGRGMDLIATPLSSGAQKARIGKVASPILCVDADLVNKTAFVKIKPSKKS